MKVGDRVLNMDDIQDKEGLFWLAKRSLKVIDDVGSNTYSHNDPVGKPGQPGCFNSILLGCHQLHIDPHCSECNKSFMLELTTNNANFISKCIHEAFECGIEEESND